MTYCTHLFHTVIHPQEHGDAPVRMGWITTMAWEQCNLNTEPKEKQHGVRDV